MNLKKDSVVVECGPGNGVFSLAILKQMTSHSKLFLIESNEEFCKYLKPRMRDPRVCIFHDNAVNIHGIVDKSGVYPVDCLILGIPFSFTDLYFNQQVIIRCKKVLRKGGKLIIYQFSPRIKKYLKQHFSEIHMDFEILNIPPLFIFEAVSEGDLCE